MQKLYLDFINNFLTVEKFAEYYQLTIEEANFIIEYGASKMLNKNLSDENIIAIINNYNDNDYRTCQELENELNSAGWGCSWSLDGVVYDLRKLQK